MPVTVSASPGMFRPSFRIHSEWLVIALSVLFWTLKVPSTEGFAAVPVPIDMRSFTSTKPLVQLSGEQEGGRFRTLLNLQKGWFVPEHDDSANGSGNGQREGESTSGGGGGGGSSSSSSSSISGGDEEQENKYRYVTREMLQRDLLSDPQVKRKNKKKGGYIPLDNRDHLPYVVKQITPDPYTKYDVKKSKQSLSKANSKRTDLDLIGSRLSVRAANKNDPSTILGEFQLDKSTTSGDIICISDRTYKVETARCQYKYAGGQRFVMVRKILEVKEITRAMQEAQLEKQLALSVGTLESKFDDTDKRNNP